MFMRKVPFNGIIFYVPDQFELGVKYIIAVKTRRMEPAVCKYTKRKYRSKQLDTNIY